MHRSDRPSRNPASPRFSGWLAPLAAVAAALWLSVAAAGAETIAVSATRSTPSAPLFIAKEKGFFAEQGMDIDFKFFTAAQPVAVAVVSGDAAFGVTGLTAAFYNLASKSALKIIGGGAREEPGSYFSAYMASMQAYGRGLRSAGQLGGTTFGMTTMGSPFHYDLAILAEKYGFPLASIKLVPLQNFNNVASALKGGTVDAALLTSAVALPVDQRGDGKIIAWVGDETPWQLGAIFTSASLVATQRDTVRRFLTAYRKGAALYDHAFPQGKVPDGAPKPEAAALLHIIATYAGLTDAEALRSLGYVDRDAKLQVDDVHHQVAVWKKLGYVDASLDPDSIIDLSF